MLHVFAVFFLIDLISSSKMWFLGLRKVVYLLNQNSLMLNDYV